MDSTLSDKLKVPATLWEGLKRAGVDRAEVVRRASLPLSVLKDDAPVTTAQFFALWRAIESVSGDPAIGLRIATSLDESVMPLAFVAGYHARDFRDALTRVARFKRLCAPEQVSLTETNEQSDLVIHWSHAGASAAPSSMVDATMVSLVEMGRRGTGERLVPRNLELTRPAASRSALDRYFGCPIQFGATVDRISFLREDLSKLFVSYNKELLEVLAPELDRRLAYQETNSVAEQTKWALRRRLTAGRPDIRSVAAELAMSERSLQRRLTDEGVNFQVLVSETRHKLALEYLADPSLTLIEVAFMLGYEDQNSFFRAFKQWENQTPLGWRTANIVPATRTEETR